MTACGLPANGLTPYLGVLIMYMMSFRHLCNERGRPLSTEVITVAQARSDFSNLLAQADLLDRRFVIARRGKPKAALVSIKDLARLEALERAAASPSADREQAIQALQQAGLLQPVSADLINRYVHLTPEDREQARIRLAQTRFDPPLSEQIIEDRGEK